MKQILPILAFVPLFGIFHAYAQSEWESPFDGASHLDFYFDFEEEADPEEVFEFGSGNILKINGKDQPNGYIQTLDEYENYEIEFDWHWPDEPGNSGILIHSNSDPAWSIWPESIEIQLQYENVGDFWLLNSKLEVEEEQMPIKSKDRDRRLRLKVEKLYDKLEDKPERWNSMHIVAKDDTIKVFINDELVNEGKNASRTSGYITIQAEGADLEIRNFRIRELDSDE